MKLSGARVDGIPADVARHDQPTSARCIQEDAWSVIQRPDSTGRRSGSRSRAATFATARRTPGRQCVCR